MSALKHIHVDHIDKMLRSRSYGSYRTLIWSVRCAKKVESYVRVTRILPVFVEQGRTWVYRAEQEHRKFSLFWLHGAFEKKRNRPCAGRCGWEPKRVNTKKHHSQTNLVCVYWLAFFSCLFAPRAICSWRCMAKPPWLCSCNVYLCLVVCDHRAQYEELTTFSRRWLTHTVYETKGVSPCNGWLVAFHWVRVRVRVTVRVYIIQRLCQPFSRQKR